jgi:murein DD-endopeptidase MepM/ murein hydrolase activator NlpD
MKKSLLFTILAFLLKTNVIFSQTESIESKMAFEKFQGYYNADQPDSIFNQFSAQTKTALPLEKTKAFLSQLKSRYGNIKNTSFLNYQSGFSVYKTEFDKGILQLSVAVDKTQAITGLYAKPYEPDSLPALKRNSTPMSLPFRGEWTVFWGGDTKELNYHVATRFQKNAFDIIQTDQSGKSYKTDGKKNEDYYAFGQDIIAPCDGAVVFAVDGIKDNVPGVMNTFYIPGNSILLITSNKEYILLAHFKQGSVKVKQGDPIKQGQVLGLCGNSGNSSEPHLHFHLQNTEDFNIATGVKCYFNKLLVNGVSQTDYSPVKGDKIRN